MHNVLVIGGGKIGSLISFLLARSNIYFVHLADITKHNIYVKKLSSFPNFKYSCLDANDTDRIAKFIVQHKITAVLSSLPYYCNVAIAKLAKEYTLHYFDLTEDVATTQAVYELAQEARTAFVPQCGLAPGFISIVSNELMRHFDELDTVKMRVGALPQNVGNGLNYALTWSTEGLINEYGNTCYAVMNGQEVALLPLEGLESIQLDGLVYEAFNTSGGIGSLVQSYAGKVKQLNYKTLRYPGHCEKIKFLMNDLGLNKSRDILKQVLEVAIPKIYQDVVLVYVSVSGKQSGQLIEENYVKKFYPKLIDGERWTAIQLTTASAICAVVDLVLHEGDTYQGLIRQEQFSLHDLVTNRFGEYYI